MMPKACPDCGAGLREKQTACACGWRAAPAATHREASGPDPDWWRCADVLIGQRCAKAGTMSRNTHGGGPWYCGAHFRYERPGEKSAPAGGFQPIRALVARVAPDPEADAERAAIQGEPMRGIECTMTSER